MDRLLPKDRSLMNWKRSDCHTLLALPRPYPRSLYPKVLREPRLKKQYTIDLVLESLTKPVSSGRLLHIIEVDSEFEVKGVQPYKK